MARKRNNRPKPVAFTDKESLDINRFIDRGASVGEAVRLVLADRKKRSRR